MTRARRPVALATALATAAGLALATASPIAATPTTPAVVPAHLVLDEGFPRRTVLVEPPVDEADASLRLGLAGWHDVVRRLNTVQDSSDRVSVQVVGTSTEGRDLLLVTLTAPESPVQARQQQRMRDRLTQQPAQAAGDRGLARSYKLPVLVNANVHGNEWEGTDAVLRLVEEYATSRDPEVGQLMERHRIHLLVSANPDGRVAGTRRNPAGFDLNRDLVTASQPETAALRDTIVQTQPALAVDLHGYVNGTLVEPTTPPHGETYETDLLLRHAYPHALAVEEAIVALGHGEDDGVRPPQVPLRDWAEGWDGWPPIFVPQYAQLHGAVASTIELPLRVNNSAYELGTDELERRAAINTDIAHAAISATIGYAAQHREQLLADQIEIFRRGVTGALQVPVEDGLFGVAGPEDVYLTHYPRAYVIPSGEGQRSAPAAARLVDLLVANDVAVTRLSRDSTIAGRTYPAGSYVVDLHQAKRAVAQTLLGRGSDISERVDAMYDISGWSHGLLWGADVVSVPESAPLRIVGTPVEEAGPSGSLAPSSTGWVLPMTDPADVAAVSTLLDQGVGLELLEDGTVLVPAWASWAAGEVARVHGAELAAAPEDASGTPVPPTAGRVGVAASAEERWAFGEMGLTVEPVSTQALNDGLDLDGLEALYVSSGLSWRDLDHQARVELQAFVAAGGGIVGRGPAGAALNEALGLLDVTPVAGRSDANGVVQVDNDPASPVAGAAPAHTFVYSPLWFADLGRGVRADQRYAQDPLVSGHWRSTTDGGGGPASAAGEAVVVSGSSAQGARVVLLGSEPLFRAHPKGQYAVVARSLLWAGAARADGRRGRPGRARVRCPRRDSNPH